MSFRTSPSLSARFALTAAALLLPFSAMAQSSTTTKKHVSRHETNASRQARIQRTVDDTYSHRWEVFGGGGWLRYKSGDSLRRNNEVSWAVATNYNLTPKLFVVGDARGSFGYGKVNNNIYGVYNPQINEYFFQGGAGLRVYAAEKISVSVQALGGVTDGVFSGGAKGLYGYQLGMYNDGIRPAFNLGVNADYNVFPNLAVRLAPTYQATMFANGPGVTSTSSSSFQNHFGINAGVVYRFGRQ